MTKEDKFEIGLTLNKIAMLLSDEDFHKVKDLLKHVEKIVAEQTEPQTCSVNGRPYSECANCEHFKCMADEPQTERSK